MTTALIVILSVIVAAETAWIVRELRLMRGGGNDFSGGG